MPEPFVCTKHIQGPKSQRHLTAMALLALVATGVFSVPAHSKAPHELFGAYFKGSSETVDHSAWTSLLGKYVRNGSDGLNRVDYKAFKSQDHGELKSYIKSLTQVNVAGLDRPEQFAFWANLYNAKTIDIVLRHYPVKSIKDISLGGSLTSLFTGGPWKAKVVKLNNTELSLDDIEHGILRKVFSDPRVHYAVNCASIGCPNLRTKAFTGADLESDLDAAARDYINTPRGVKVRSGRATASSIYNWFQEDFGGSERGVLKHVSRYAADDLKAKLQGVSTISDYAYDWGLNDAR